IGSRTTVFSTRGLREGGSALGSRPRVRQFNVAGIYDTGFPDFDEQFAYIDLDVAREFFQYGAEEITRLDLVLSNIDESSQVAEEISFSFGPPVFARSIYQVFGSLFAWIDLQRSIIPLLISVLIVVAAFNIIGVLLLLILDKSREIGILLAVGASRLSIRSLYVWLGAFIGTLGAAVGILLALAFAFVQIRFGVIPLPPEAYFIDHAPVELQIVDFVVVPAVAIVLCTAAAYFPARSAAGIEPLRSIRFSA
ncbi:MAG: FtsX-like permease family protein, partial [Rubricoccaceae bacterium]|nr:FtsX-like permease family protein [Rubricoccaceae bacterium]